MVNLQIAVLVLLKVEIRGGHRADLSPLGGGQANLLKAGLWKAGHDPNLRCGKPRLLANHAVPVVILPS